MKKIICPKCLNKDKRYFTFNGDELFCRKCASFIGKTADFKYELHKGNYSLEYNLTDKQKEASEFVLSNVKRGNNCALNAVCGAGKTEIIYDTLEYCLNNKKKIGIAIPRKDVVVELQNRISQDFNVKVIGVYGGHNKCLEADIIIFTTHQSFRYIDYFDVLIIDEVDAFPFKGNNTLQNILSRCSKCFVYLSATMPRYIEIDKNIEKFYLNKRYHGFNIPVPKIVECLFMLSRMKILLKKYKDKVTLVYFPTIKIQRKISKIINYDYLVNSKSENRDELLSKIKKLDKGVVLTTTVLERGITIKNVQVIVYNSEHKLFDKDTLIQISGRVGRNKEYNDGNIIFLCKNKSKSMSAAIKQIRKSNA